MGFSRSLTPTACVVCAVLPGCGLILDFDPRPAAPADADAPDAAWMMDAGPDLLRDAFVPDAFVPPPDARIDADAIVDAGLPDADAWDGAAGDAGSDAGSDGGTDAGPPEGCADGTVEQGYRGTTDMVGCDGGNDQCTAHLLCAPGWHLCSWDDYGIRGGADQPATAERWIAACVRNSCASITPVAPSNAACGACGPASTAVLTLQYDCPGDGPSEEVACNVGAAADNAARRIGLPSVPCTMSRTARTDALLGATCCR